MTARGIFAKFFIPTLVFCISFLAPIFNLSFDIQNLLNLVSLLFVIILGFFIAAATSNYLNFQSNLAEENSALIALHNLVKLVRPSSAEKLADLIDYYVIKTLDYKIGEFADQTYKEFMNIIQAIDEIKADAGNPDGQALLSYMHEVKTGLLKTRESTLLVAGRVVSAIHWTILVMLTLVIEFLLLSTRDGSLSAYILVGIVTVSLYLVLILLYEIDNNIFLEKQLAYKDPQKVFKAIGRLPYYPETAIKYRIVKKLGERYRVGFYKNYPKSFDKIIKTVGNKPRHRNKGVIYWQRGHS